MVYESNPKHKHPWQRGRKGSLCPKSMSIPPQELLEKSVLGSDGKRYATCEGRCYCAQEHQSGHWHGYPIGWNEVLDQKLVRAWLDEGTISKKDLRNNS